jgi:hypothetical protein
MWFLWGSVCRSDVFFCYSEAVGELRVFSKGVCLLFMSLVEENPEEPQEKDQILIP